MLTDLGNVTPFPRNAIPYLAFPVRDRLFEHGEEFARFHGGQGDDVILKRDVRVFRAA